MVSKKPNLDTDDDYEQLDKIDEKEFEEIFTEQPAADPVEEEKRAEALKENEENIKENNEKFKEGKITWIEELNPYSNEPDDEFDERLGADTDFPKGRGLILPDEDEVDEESERYFDMYRMDRADVPDSYSSVDLGYVSPVKDQGRCGSCVAFSSAAVVETCFKKLTGVFGDYSEQQMVSCGFGKFGAKGCRSAAPNAYLKWIVDENVNLAQESAFPYKAKN